MRINRQFGDYFVIKRIGVGGMAEIFLALRKGPGAFEKLYALKAIMGGREDNPTFVYMFQTEAEVAAKFNHPHVVQLYDVVTIDGTEIMVMEFMPGHTLGDVVQLSRERSKPLPPDLAVFLLMEVCEGLDYIHSLTDWDGTALGIVHRDVTPENIMVTYDGVAKVFDFGITRLATRPDNTHMLGSMVGKPGYMSPEQVRGEHIDARSDVFAMGCVLWELTVGRPLFDQKNDLQLINALIEDPILRPSEVVDRYPRLLERIVMRALEKEPGERFESCGELRAELHKYLKISALKPDRLQAAAFMSDVFTQEIAEFRTDMEDARRISDDKDPTLSIDVGQLMAAVGTDFGAALVAQNYANKARVSVPKPQGAAAAAAAVHPPAPAPVPPAPATDPQLAPPEGAMRAMPPATAPRPGRGPVLVLAIIAVVMTLVAVAAVIYVVTATSSPGATAPVDKVATLGSLRVVSEPAGASLRLNDRPLSVKTPVTLPGLALGEPIALVVHKDGFAPSEHTVTLSAADPDQTVTVNLEVAGGKKAAGEGAVRLSTTPSDATVTLDDKPVEGESPLTLEGVAAGEEHTLRVSADGFTEELMTFTIEPGEVKDFEVELVEAMADEEEPAVAGAGTATLSIDTTPAADIYEGTRKLGRAPLDVELPAGRHRIELREVALGISYIETVQLEAGKPSSLMVTVPRGTLVVKASPEARVDVDGASIGTTPIAEHSLYAGNHVVRLSVPSLNRTKEYRIKLKGDDTKTIDETFRPVAVARVEDGKGGGEASPKDDGEKAPAVEPAPRVVIPKIPRDAQPPTPPTPKEVDPYPLLK